VNGCCNLASLPEQNKSRSALAGAKLPQEQESVK